MRQKLKLAISIKEGEVVKIGFSYYQYNLEGIDVSIILNIYEELKIIIKQNYGILDLIKVYFKYYNGAIK